MMVLDRIAMVLFLDTGISMMTSLITVDTMSLLMVVIQVCGTMMKILRFQEPGHRMMVMQKELGMPKRMNQ